MRDMMEKRDVTAVFFTKHLYAISAVSYANQAGFRIPEDVAIVTFDDSVENASLHPVLSAVRQPMFEIGAKAAQLILERMAKPKKPYETCLLPTELILRKSI